MSTQPRIDFLSEEKFWKIIEAAHKDSDDDAELLVDTLVETLAEKSEKEIIGFDYQFSKAMRKSYTSELWCTAYVACGGCSDDGFDYFRAWLVSRGKEIFTKALKNPDTLIHEFLKLSDGEYPELEGILYVASSAYEAKTGNDLYEALEQYSDDIEEYPSLQFNWDENNPESLKVICPEVYDNFYENPL
ncbi:MAG: DUF4240 domain-containing protein [Cytophagaceae bacterium]|jgi:hypothetical protein|nr:DUF4240 domain-containing protein [Cytophagaceae bacterium]